MEKEIEDVKKLMEEKKFSDALNKLYDLKNKYDSNEIKKYDEYFKYLEFINDKNDIITMVDNIINLN
jgi:hypothetical protein